MDAADVVVEAGAGRVRCQGRWTLEAIDGLADRLPRLALPEGRPVRLEADGITALDTSGAWLLQRLRLRLEAAGGAVELHGLEEPHATLLRQVGELGTVALPRPARLGLLAGMGRGTLRFLEELYSFLSFFGATVTRSAWLLLHPGHIRWRAIFVELYGAGVTALGIVGLLSFLMGVVIAYQGAVQLRA